VVRPSRCTQILMVLSLGLSLMCGTARAQLVFSTPKNISNNADFSIAPQMAADASGHIYVVWQDSGATSNILFSFSADSGNTFSTPKNLSNSTGSSFSPSIALDAQGGINVVWVDNTPGNQDIFFSRSTDGGATFSTPKNLSNDPPNNASPKVAVDGSGNISVLWENDDITYGVFYTHSTDGGATFSTPVNLATNTSGSFNSRLALDSNGSVYVVWEDHFVPPSGIASSAIFFSRSADKGSTFSAAMSISSNSSSTPALALAANGSVNVSWVDHTASPTNVFFSRSTDSGTTFLTPKSLSDGLANSNHSQISTDSNGAVYVVWDENSVILFARSTDGGVTFSAPLSLSNNTDRSLVPGLAVDATGNVSVSWADSNAGPQQVFFAQSVDHGATFSAPQNLSNDVGFSGGVQMAADIQGNLNVVWDDNVSGVNQIFFSRFTNPKKANQPPVASAVADPVVECASPAGTPVMLDGSASTDPNGDTLTFVWKDDSGMVVGTSAKVLVMVSLGAHAYTLTVTDSANLSSTAQTVVTVKDTTAPTLRVTLSTKVRRPEEDELVLVQAKVNVSDSCDAHPQFKLVSITSNDPPEPGRHQRRDIQAAHGDGPVAFGTPVTSFRLRAERPENHQAVVYTITYAATDASNNTKTITLTLSLFGAAPVGKRHYSEH
jgi:hypothetical protein